jgi:beta-1,4-mannosyl-glycoprotein beta-1,4-N-acetylglucosaminyltransferase
MFHNKKIIDCVLYNGELDILKLRLQLYNELVDEFHITEANQTFTGIQKNDLLESLIEIELKPFSQKIYYHLITELPESNSPWDKEYFLREKSLELASPKDDDLVIVSDVDEILNLDYVLKNYNHDKINVVEIDCFYYYYNLASNEKMDASLLAIYSLLKDKKIGKRYNFCSEEERNFMLANGGRTGGHFTYQFGSEIDKYIKKVKSFSHQEYNNDFYLNPQKLKFLIENEMDIFHRFKFQYKKSNLKKTFPKLNEIINENPTYQKTKRSNFLVLINQLMFKEYRVFKYYNLKHKIKVLLKLVKD